MTQDKQLKQEDEGPFKNAYKKVTSYFINAW